MNSTNRKIILTDADGCLFNWIDSFLPWMVEQGYQLSTDFHKFYAVDQQFNIDRKTSRKLIKQFNESKVFLPPFKDVIKYFRKLHYNHNYVFHVITSFTDKESAIKHRQRNLQILFGNSAVTKLICLPCGANKDKILEQYKNTKYWWIEDKPSNADVGLSLGLNSILIKHDYNTEYKGNAICINTWKDIYNLII